MGVEDRIGQLKNRIDDCIKCECIQIQKSANPREEVERYHRSLRWESPELADYVKKELLNILNLDY